MSRILLCEPKYFDVRYQINPWMTRTNKVDFQLAQKQWQGLQRALTLTRASLEYVTPDPAWPDMVFTANAAFVINNKAYLSHFSHPERQGERAHFKRWFVEAGFEIWGDKAEDYQQQDGEPQYHGPFFEGAGDALMVGEVMVAGYGFRSKKGVYERFQEMGVKQILMCHLVDPRFYHLDTCFCPLNDKQALWWPGAFSAEAQELLQNSNIELFAVNSQEAHRFACNSVVIGNQIIMPTGSDEAGAEMQRLGFTVQFVEMSEFLKSGGACKCLTLAV